MDNMCCPTPRRNVVLTTPHHMGETMTEEAVKLALDSVVHRAIRLVEHHEISGLNCIAVDIELLKDALDTYHRRKREHFNNVLQRAEELTAATAE